MCPGVPLLFVVGLLAPVGATGPQESQVLPNELEALSPGMRLRVTAPDQSSKPIVGTLVSVDSSALTLQTPKETVAVRREDISKLELSLRRSSKKKAALTGAAVGLMLALASAATTGSDDWFSPADAALITGIVFIPVGAGIGALAGHGERWGPVLPANAPPAPAVRTHGPGGLQLGLSLRF